MHTENPQIWLLALAFIGILYQWRKLHTQDIEYQDIEKDNDLYEHMD